jgi:predicted membrane protein
METRRLQGGYRIGVLLSFTSIPIAVAKINRSAFHNVVPILLGPWWATASP